VHRSTLWLCIVIPFGPYAVGCRNRRQGGGIEVDRSAIIGWCADNTGAGLVDTAMKRAIAGAT
jgi:hypothetical protein